MTDFSFRKVFASNLIYVSEHLLWMVFLSKDSLWSHAGHLLDLFSVVLSSNPRPCL